MDNNEEERVVRHEKAKRDFEAALRMSNRSVEVLQERYRVRLSDSSSNSGGQAKKRRNATLVLLRPDTLGPLTAREPTLGTETPKSATDSLSDKMRDSKGRCARRLFSSEAE